VAAKDLLGPGELDLAGAGGQPRFFLDGLIVAYDRIVWYLHGLRVGAVAQRCGSFFPGSGHCWPAAAFITVESVAFFGVGSLSGAAFGEGYRSHR
jgi:hypothetical protein